jgi:hypothetical protein
MKGVVYHTDKEWFNYLINHDLLNDVNFWTKQKHNLNIQEGDTFFFKTSDQEIVGIATFKSYEKNIPINEAWVRFGPKNGVGSLDELKSKLKDILKISEDITEISVIVLDNLVKFKHPVKLEKVGLEKFKL